VPISVLKVDSKIEVKEMILKLFYPAIFPLYFQSYYSLIKTRNGTCHIEHVMSFQSYYSSIKTPSESPFHAQLFGF
jgi:hypothetical protein